MLGDSVKSTSKKEFKAIKPGAQDVTTTVMRKDGVSNVDFSKARLASEAHKKKGKMQFDAVIEEGDEEKMRIDLTPD